MGQLLSFLPFLVPGENQEDIQFRQLTQRKIEQDKIINQIRSIENCVYYYLDNRIEKLLMPWAQKEFPWDLNSEMLSTFREKPQDQTKN